MTPLILCALALNPAGVASSAGSGVEWAFYRNGRFGYAIEYPSSLVTAQPESANGDGRVFTSTTGDYKLTVWASFNVLELNRQLLRSEAIEYWKSNGGVISYSTLLRSGFQIAGRSGNLAFFQKTLIIEDWYVSFAWEFPAREKRAMEPVIARLSRSLRHDN